MVNTKPMVTVVSVETESLRETVGAWKLQTHKCLAVFPYSFPESFPSYALTMVLIFFSFFFLERDTHTDRQREPWFAGSLTKYLQWPNFGPIPEPGTRNQKLSSRPRMQVAETQLFVLSPATSA